MSARQRKLLLAYVNTQTGVNAQRMMPLGLQLVSALARDAGWQVVGRFWGAELTRDSFAADLTEQQPDLLGFYVDLLNTHTIARLLKRLPSTLRPPTILGGPEASFNYRRTLESCPADVLVRGDAEPVLPELLRGDPLDPERLARFPGVSYRRGDDLVHNPESRPPSRGTSALPDRRLDPANHEVLHLLTARGCPHGCSFCSEASVRYRPRPLKDVFAEVKSALAVQRPAWIQIVDDTFTANARRARRIADFLRTEYGGPWSCEVRADEICRDATLATDLAADGLTRVQIGIESVNASTLELYRKRITPEQTARAIERLLDAGVRCVFGNFIIGAPEETAAMVRHNLRFATDLMRRHPGRVELSASILSYNPGAPFFDEPAAFGLHFDEVDLLSAIDLRSPVCGNQTLSREEILQLQAEFSSALSSTADEVLKHIPREVMEDHLRFHALGIQTIWAQKLLAQKHISRFHHFVEFARSHRDLCRASDSQLADAIPQRTRLEVQLGLNGNVVLHGLPEEVRELNPTASFLYEMANGQFSIRRIADRLHAYLPGNGRPSKETILQDALRFYRDLGREMHMVFVDVA